MKNFWKVLAAMMVIALPFIASSCGSDDEDNGPWTITYYWKFLNLNIDQIPDDEQGVVIAARTSITNYINAAYETAGFKVDKNEKTFSKVITVNDEKTINQLDELVMSTLLDLKRTSKDFQEASDKLPNNTTLQVWRNGKYIFENQSLK